MNTGNYIFFCPAKTGCGLNALEHLPFDLSNMGVRKPLVIQDNRSHQAGLIKILARAFGETHMSLSVCPPFDPEVSDTEQLKAIRHLFTARGFDAVIALGTGRLADMAKAATLTVSLGPEILKTWKSDFPVSQPITPWAYVPTGAGSGMETGGRLQFNHKRYDSSFLMPGIVVVDPTVLTPDTSGAITDTSLGTLAICCEADAGSNSSPTRAYAATAISLVMESMIPLLHTKPPLRGRPDKKKFSQWHVNLVQAAVITGYVLANCKTLLSVRLGRSVTNHSNASKGQVMAVLLVAVLKQMQEAAVGNLLLPLCGIDTYADTPPSRRPDLVIQKIQGLLDELHELSRSATPRTLADAGMDVTDVESVVRTIHCEELGLSPQWIEELLTQALTGNADYRK